MEWKRARSIQIQKHLLSVVCKNLILWACKHMKWKYYLGGWICEPYAAWYYPKWWKASAVNKNFRRKNHYFSIHCDLLCLRVPIPTKRETSLHEAWLEDCSHVFWHMHLCNGTWTTRQMICFFFKREWQRGKGDAGDPLPSSFSIVVPHTKDIQHEHGQAFRPPWVFISWCQFQKTNLCLDQKVTFGKTPVSGCCVL